MIFIESLKLQVGKKCFPGWKTAHKVYDVFYGCSLGPVPCHVRLAVTVLFAELTKCQWKLQFEKKCYRGNDKIWEILTIASLGVKRIATCLRYGT